MNVYTLGMATYTLGMATYTPGMAVYTAGSAIYTADMAVLHDWGLGLHAGARLTGAPTGVFGAERIRRRIQAAQFSFYDS